jgi:predicted house-cleaning NTP pyrophosphatase (Maf/HAM1 superfamily)
MRAASRTSTASMVLPSTRARLRPEEIGREAQIIGAATAVADAGRTVGKAKKQITAKEKARA